VGCWKTLGSVLASSRPKAFLTFDDQPFRKTHDLASLGKQCTNIDATSDALVDRLDDLSAKHTNVY